MPNAKAITVIHRVDTPGMRALPAHRAYSTAAAATSSVARRSALAVLRALTGAAGGGHAPGVGVRVVPGDGSAAEVTERILVAEDDPADSGYPDPLAQL